MLEGVWGWVAHPGASLAAASLLTAVLLRRGKHVDQNNELLNMRVVSFFLLGATTYTFAVIVASNLIFDGPPASELIGLGFGDQRISWLILGVFLESTLRVWSYLR